MADRSDPTLASAAGPADGGEPTRIAIQSADRLRRETLAVYLQNLPDFTVVGRVARYEDILPLWTLEQPAIVLVDAGHGIREAVAGCRLLRDRCPDLTVVVMCEQLTAHELHALRAADVAALVPYGHGLAGLVAVLRKLAAGEPAVHSSNAGLSRRQREVLLLLASGHSTTEIAELLSISPGTVESHKRQVYAKLGVTSALQAVARAASWGLVDDEQLAGDQAGVDADWLPAPPAGWLPTVENGRPPLTVATGGDLATLDHAVAVLVAHGLPVIRDTSPSWSEPMHALRWHRGPVARVLADPGADHWRVAAASWRRTIVVRSRHYRTSAMTVFANGGVALLRAQHIDEHLVPVLMLVTQGYYIMDRGLSRPFEHSTGAPFTGREQQKPTLTAREYDILASIGRSLTIRQTARRLGIAVKTVENTQVHLFRKLGVHSRAEALAAAYALGLLRPDTV